MKIYNTMTGKKEEFVPIDGDNVRMYACGVTVYDLCHIGHARQAIVYAMITDYLRFRGYNVRYVRNYTDVDDKIIKKANELGMDALKFSREQIKEADKDMEALHITAADEMTKASEYISKIIAFVAKLIENGHAYATSSGDVYFKVHSFSEYGKLSHKNVDELLNGVRINLEDGKENPIDFALWKSAKPGEISWASPWGAGRPGWHIECSAMVLDTLGESIDIHGGGRDLMFPHHENEIAQSEALTGKQFVKYWSHCGLIKINGEKMSKSLGNSLTIRDALKKYNYEVLKYTMLNKHYSSDIDIHDEDFSLAENHLFYFYSIISQMKRFVSTNKGHSDGEKVADDISNRIKNKFIEFMDDDFNTSTALAELHSIFKYASNLMKSPKEKQIPLIANTLAAILKEVSTVYGVLGFFTQDPDAFVFNMKSKYLRLLNISEDYILEQIELRKFAKQKKDFVTADKIRNELDTAGIVLGDTREGTTWNIKALC